MNIVFHNLDANGELNVTGPSVPVDMRDGGTAQVMLTLAMSDGSTFTSVGTQTTPPSTLLPPGQYTCALVDSAFNHGAFGDHYRSTITVGGKLLATAEGRIPQGSECDSTPAAFVLRVS